MNHDVRALDGGDPTSTSLTPQQNRAILIAGLTCACFSVLCSIITLRWFLLMKRAFRHRLVMFLIFSDTFKALWYFVFPIVVFSRGSVQTSSGFCQASGFFLALGIEASDFAILMIALHSILYIFHPPASSNEKGGLFRYRKYVYPFWIALPLLSASLAFINHGRGYATAGTFCYLPRRPFWYRLALSWIPRYCIISLIAIMYLAVYIYVTLKFRSFSNLGDSQSGYSSSSSSRRPSISSDDDDSIAPDEPVRSPQTQSRPRFSRPTFSRNQSHDGQAKEPARELDPWDQVSFITAKGLKNPGWQPGIETSDFAWGSQKSSLSAAPPSPQTAKHSRHDLSSAAMAQGSRACGSPAGLSQLSGNTAVVDGRTAGPNGQLHSGSGGQTAAKDPLQRTRKAIRRQLRYLFIYPAVYVLMWTFPFASHCLLYDDYYVRHPIFWLTVLQTCTLSLQAGVDCIVFSWREKPWRRIPEGRKFSFSSFRESFSLGHKRGSGSSADQIAADDHPMSPRNTASVASSRVTSNNWWEAEGLKRKDSVWMGTDNATYERRETFAQIPATTPVLEEAEEGQDLCLTSEQRRKALENQSNRVER